MILKTSALVSILARTSPSLLLICFTFDAFGGAKTGGGGGGRVRPGPLGIFAAAGLKLFDASSWSTALARRPRNSSSLRRSAILFSISDFASARAFSLPSSVSSNCSRRTQLRAAYLNQTSISHEARGFLGRSTPLISPFLRLDEQGVPRERTLSGVSRSSSEA